VAVGDIGPGRDRACGSGNGELLDSSDCGWGPRQFPHAHDAFSRLFDGKGFEWRAAGEGELLQEGLCLGMECHTRTVRFWHGAVIGGTTGLVPTKAPRRSGWKYLRDVLG
jgi:hypothetical protein